MQVRVDPEALTEWSVAARRVADRIATAHTQLAPHVGGWDGDAADAYRLHLRQWQDAATGMLTVLGEVTTLVDTAEANYRSAIAANGRIWGIASSTAGGPAVLSAMSAGGGRGGIDVETEDIRVTVRALGDATDSLARAWETLAGALSGTAAMAGDDPAGGAFGRDHDVLAGTAWQGWRSATILLDAIVGGLAETGNNIIRAETDSTAGGGAAEPIAVATRPVPAPAPPPAAVGDNGNRSGVAPLAHYWPTSDPARLRAAATAWRGSADGLRDAVGRARNAVTGLVDTNPDPVLHQMRSFTEQVLSEDYTTGLMGVLIVTGETLAGACDRLADVTDETRNLMRDAIAQFFAGDEWYHPVATVLDAVITRGAAKLVALGGDLALLDLRLSAVHDDHVRAVDLVRASISAGTADRLARIATALTPPSSGAADTCAVTSPAGVAGNAVPEGGRQALIDEAVASGVKMSPNEVLHIGRAPDGRIVWIERGTGKAGLAHLLRAERIGNFMDRGIAPTDIGGLAVRAVTDGNHLGRVGSADVYDVDVGEGRSEKIVVLVGSNGYIVTARPLGSNEMPR